VCLECPAVPVSRRLAECPCVTSWPSGACVPGSGGVSLSEASRLSACVLSASSTSSDFEPLNVQRNQDCLKAALDHIVYIIVCVCVCVSCEACVWHDGSGVPEVSRLCA